VIDIRDVIDSSRMLHCKLGLVIVFAAYQSGLSHREISFHANVPSTMRRTLNYRAARRTMMIAIAPRTRYVMIGAK
jgi:hypothetical protein